MWYYFFLTAKRFLAVAFFIGLFFDLIKLPNSLLFKSKLKSKKSLGFLSKARASLIIVVTVSGLPFSIRCIAERSIPIRKPSSSRENFFSLRYLEIKIPKSVKNNSNLFFCAANFSMNSCNLFIRNTKNLLIFHFYVAFLVNITIFV